MDCVILLDARGEPYCQNCKVPFTGWYKITPEALAACKGDYTRFHRPCHTQLARTEPLLPKHYPSLPILTPQIDYTTCVHRGADTRRIQECSTCAGKTQLKIFSCKIYGECALSFKASAVAVCSATCPSLELP